MIRLLDALARIMAETTSEAQRRVLLEQAAMISRACERSVPEAADRADIQRRYEAVLTAETRLTAEARLAAEAGLAAEARLTDSAGEQDT
jgi:uncharacterized membrane protein